MLQNILLVEIFTSTEILWALWLKHSLLEERISQVQAFKAGGPNYILQFMDERVVTVNTVAIGGNIDLINLDQDE